jgi:hypothetical protein
MDNDEAQRYATRLKAWILREIALDRGLDCKPEDLSGRLVSGINTIALTVAFGLEIPDEPEDLTELLEPLEEWEADDERATPVVLPTDYSRALDAAIDGRIDASQRITPLDPYSRTTVPNPRPTQAAAPRRKKQT